MQITDDIYLLDIYVSIERCILPVSIDLHTYELFDKTYNNKDVFDILTHHVLKDIYEEIVAALRLGKIVILYNNTSFNIKESEYIINTPDRIRAINRLVKLILRLVPASVITRPYNIYQFAQEFQDRNALAVLNIEEIIQKRFKNAFRSFNLNRTINYLENRGLKYLSTDYFQQINNKLLAANK